MAESAEVSNLVEVVGEYASSCGYCHSKMDSSVAFGMTAERLTVQAYQDLLDQGWRRSGTWLYLPSFQKTCCPCYTHRLEASKFVPDKGQRRVQRKFDAFLAGKEPAGTNSKDRAEPAAAATSQQADGQAADAMAAPILDALQAAVQACITDGMLPACMNMRAMKVMPPTSQAVKAAGVLYTSPAAMALAAAARKGGACASSMLSGQELAAHLARRMSDAKSFDWSVEAAAGHLNFSHPAVGPVPASRCQAAGGLSPPQISHFLDEQNAGGRASSSQHASSSARDAGIAAPCAGQNPQRDRRRGADGFTRDLHRRLEVVMVPSSAKLVQLEFPLFRKYQIQHHKDPPSKVTASSFKRFLIDSPLVPVLPSEQPIGGCPPCGFGSFHQQYWVDGVLVAVGVVDVLPSCMSSKYFFWDPELAALSLGKVSAMQEISWVAAASKTCPSLKYLYLGYFIADCPKMRYKVDFRPAELLCPRRLVWVPYQGLESALKQSTRVALSEVPGALLSAQRQCCPQDGQPAYRPTEVSGNSISSTRVLIPTDAGKECYSTVQQLIQQHVLPEAFLPHLLIRIGEWRRLIGPQVADNTALIL